MKWETVEREKKEERRKDRAEETGKEQKEKYG